MDRAVSRVGDFQAPVWLVQLLMPLGQVRPSLRWEPCRQPAILLPAWGVGIFFYETIKT